MIEDYYDGTKLLSMLDLDNKTPAMYLCTTNRSAGKTTYFSRLCVKKFIENGEKFIVLYRFKYELDDCARKFFKEIGQLFFEGHEMKEKKRAGGVYVELFLDDVSCGYCLALNTADSLKRMSHIFSDAQRILFDEFQSEQNNYAENEIRKFVSLYTTVARGGGEQARYVPVYMLANNITVLNPYYATLRIAERLKKETNFLRGKGWVLEQGYNEAASEALQGSAFLSAFEDSITKYMSGEKVYLYDDSAFIETPKGTNRYICTVRVDGMEYAVREYTDECVFYCNRMVDNKFPLKISATTEDHTFNYVMLSRYKYLIDYLRSAFEFGNFRFRDETCKNAMLAFLRYL